MPGRAAITGIAAVKSDISSINLRETPNGAGDPVGEYSPIGGQGRKGCDANLQLVDPPWTRIDAQVVGAGSPAGTLKGEQGPGYGEGRTFGSSSRGRVED